MATKFEKIPVGTICPTITNSIGDSGEGSKIDLKDFVVDFTGAVVNGLNISGGGGQSSYCNFLIF